MRRIYSFALFIVLIVPSNPAFSCATCLAGDPTLTTMGTEKPYAGRTRLSVDYLSRGETVGQPGIDEHEIDEERVTFSISYAPNKEWMFAASLPFVTREVKRFDLSREQGSGMGDLDLSARWFLGQDQRFPVRNMWGMQFSLRVPTSQEEEEGGQTLDFDAQPGAGITIPGVGVWYGRYRTPWFFYTSAVFQHAIDEGYQGYKAGDAVLITGHSQYAIGHEFAVQFSLDSRWKEQDEYDGVADGDSGGLLIMASPGAIWTPMTNLIFNLSYQIPAVEDLRGRQEEDPILRFGVTYDF